MIDLLPNATLLYQWLIFMAVFLVLHFGIFRPTLRILDERQSRTSRKKEVAHHLENESKAILNVCEKKLEETRRIAGRLREEVILDAERQAESLLKRTRGEMEKSLEETRQRVEAEAKQASLQLKQQARDLGREIASKVLERAL